MISGGEPTVHADLPAFAARLKDLGLSVKLDTNGGRPEALEVLFERNLIDYVAMDVKAPRARYEEYAGVTVDPGRIERSMALIRERAPDYEFRTTVAPGLTVDDVRTIADWIAGAKRYVLQAFRAPPGKALVDPSWGERSALSSEELEAAWEGIADRFSTGSVRV